MSAAPPTESALATCIDLELVGVAAAVLDYSPAAARLNRLEDPLEALDDPWVVHELAATITFSGMNRRAAAALGIAPDARGPGHVFSMFDASSGMLDIFKAHFNAMLNGSTTSQTEQRLPDQRIILVEWNAADTSYRHVVVTLRDVTAAHLRQAHKFEAIAELASGIAHEIKTPIQFIGDNAQLLAEIAPGVGRFHNEALKLAELAHEVPGLDRPVAAVMEAADAAGLPTTDEEIIDAVAQIQEGVSRVAEIVRAMKDFARRGGETKTPIDLNATIETTLAVARNEWKDHCEIVLDLDAGLPPVPALAEPLKQAILVLAVNASQAVQDAVGDSNQKGTIAISTAQRGDTAVIKVTDSGVGIPAEIQSRIFDPFFTTEEAGRRSGQGLTICRSAIVGQHAGTLEFETELGVGTTFTITLPLHIEEDIA